MKVHYIDFNSIIDYETDFMSDILDSLNEHIRRNNIAVERNWKTGDIIETHLFREHYKFLWDGENLVDYEKSEDDAICDSIDYSLEYLDECVKTKNLHRDWRRADIIRLDIDGESGWYRNDLLYIWDGEKLVLPYNIEDFTPEYGVMPNQFMAFVDYLPEEPFSLKNGISYNYIVYSNIKKAFHDKDIKIHSSHFMRKGEKVDILFTKVIAGGKKYFIVYLEKDVDKVSEYIRTLRGYYNIKFVDEEISNYLFGHPLPQTAHEDEIMLRASLVDLFEEDVDPEHVLFDQLSTFEYLQELDNSDS